MTIEVVGLDGDDTLWHNEREFADVQHEYRALLAHYADPAAVEQRLLATERRNLAVFGYGVKGFTLSMIETAIELSDEQVTAAEIHRIVELGRSLHLRPIELLPGVADTVRSLCGTHRLVLVTKGDLLHQETKVAASGLGDCFASIEIVSEKDPGTYRRVLSRLGVAPERFVMVGNSLRSDVLPVLDIGGHAVHVPYHLTWAIEHAEPGDHHRFPTIDSLAELPAVLRAW